MDRVVDALVDRLLKTGIDGLGRIDSAQEVADAALRKRGRAGQGGRRDRASSTLRLAASGGFVTGLGGFVTLAVSLPANVVGFYVIATRMVAAMAAVRGHDLTDDRPCGRPSCSRSAATTRPRSSARPAAARSTGRATSFALRRLPPAALMAVNKGVAFRIVVKARPEGPRAGSVAWSRSPAG